MLRDTNNGFTQKVKDEIKQKWDSITETEADIYIADAQEGIRQSRKANAKVVKDTAKAIADSSMSDKDKEASIEWLNEPRTNKQIEQLLIKLKEKK